MGLEQAPPDNLQIVEAIPQPSRPRTILTRVRCHSPEAPRYRVLLKIDQPCRIKLHSSRQIREVAETTQDKASPFSHCSLLSPVPRPTLLETQQPHRESISLAPIRSLYRVPSPYLIGHLLFSSVHMSQNGTSWRSQNIVFRCTDRVRTSFSFPHFIALQNFI